MELTYRGQHYSPKIADATPCAIDFSGVYRGTPYRMALLHQYGKSLISKGVFISGIY